MFSAVYVKEHKQETNYTFIDTQEKAINPECTENYG